MNAGVATLVLPDGSSASISVWLCGNCSFVGLRAENASALYESYARSR